MRLNDYQRSVIRDAIARHFGPDARVFLFGSRVDDGRRGGDIDLLVESPDIHPDSATAIETKLKAIATIHRGIGERKIDLILARPDSDKPVVRIARSEGVPV